MLLNTPISGNQEQLHSFQEVDGKFYWGNQELKEVTEEQKKETKTEANYYFENDRKINDSNFFIHLNKENKTFFITETLESNIHTVWLDNQQRMIFNKSHDKVGLVTEKENKFVELSNEEGHKIVQERFKSHSEKENINNKKENINNKKENLGYFQGLKKELRDATEVSGTLMLAYGVKDMITKGAGLKKHRFLKLGTAAGVVAVVAASPIAGAAAAAVVATGALITLGAAFNATLITGMHTADYLEDKIKSAFGKNKEEEVVPQTKSMFDVKSSISKIRSEAFSSNNAQTEHKIK